MAGPAVLVATSRSKAIRKDESNNVGDAGGTTKGFLFDGGRFGAAGGKDTLSPIRHFVEGEDLPQRSLMDDLRSRHTAELRGLIERFQFLVSVAD